MTALCSVQTAADYTPLTWTDLLIAGVVLLTCAVTVALAITRQQRLDRQHRYGPTRSSTPTAPVAQPSHCRLVADPPTGKATR